MESHTIISRLTCSIKRPKTFRLGLALVLSAALLLLATLFAPNLSQFTSADVQRLETTIENKKVQLEQIAKNWLSDTSSSSSAANKILTPKLISRLSSEGLAVYLFDSTKLVGWSQIPNFNQQDLDSISKKINLYKFSNSWNLAFRLHERERSAILSIEIQKSYRINNKFLENGYNALLGIPPSLILVTNSQGSKDEKLLTVGNQGKPLFSLLNRGSSSYNKPLKDFFFLLSLLLYILGGWLIFISIKIGRRILLFWGVLLLFCMTSVGLINLLAQKSPALIFFSPELYSSGFANSLATLSVYILIFGVACSAVYFHFADYKIKRGRHQNILAWSLSVFLAATVMVCNLVVYSLVNDSTISFGILKIAELSRYSIVTYMLISLPIICFILASHLFFRLFKSFTKNQKVAILLVPILFASIVLALFLREVVVAIFFTTALLNYGVFLYLTKTYSKITIGTFSLIIVIWAIGAALSIGNYIISRDLKNRIAFAESLYNENDPIVEATLPEISAQIKQDPIIRQLIKNPSQYEDSIYYHIRATYMNGYLNRYNLVVTICPENANLFLPVEKKTTSCERYFSNLFRLSGEKIGNSNFYYIRNFPGQISYMGKIDFPQDGKINTLYVEFDVKTINNNPGYPELLLKKPFIRNFGNDQYDHAHYINGVLTAKNGSYAYPTLITPPTPKERFREVRMNGYKHLMYRFDDRNTLVISRAQFRVFDLLSIFSYIFLLVSFLGLLMFKKSRFPLDDSLSFKTFRGRITLSFILVLTVALILTGIASLIYGVLRFDTLMQRTIADKMKSAIPAVLTALNNPNPNVLPTELIKVSNYLYVDVNIYKPDGELFATSRPEIFFEGLQGLKMSPNAFRKLAIEHEGFYVDKEKIGKMSFTSSYAPVFDNAGKLRCYLNLPYFLQYNELRLELYTIAIATANIFILLLLPVIFISVLISNSITRPLEQIRNRMRTFDLKINPDPIPYTKNDEIGDLIAEFNKMVYQVESSAEMLAMSERDSAWREMARQIAHEIKNPLTPMKLSLQYLMMLKAKDDRRWIEQFDRYASSQIEQIDSLASIATDFSDFAKINFDAKTPVFDMRHLVDEILPIFDGFPNLKIGTHMTDKPATVKIDREHMKRVVVNILKNSTQAFDKEEKEQINITIRREENSVLLSVEDNGKGIPDEIKKKIFTPNFTTKSSGSGLGLAISKNLIEAYNGRIWFDSQLNRGTTFYVELPYVEM